MEAPPLFSTWFKISTLMHGRKMKGTAAFEEFNLYTKGMYKDVGKTMFYVWLAKEAVDMNEDLICERNKDGKYFFMPNAYEKYQRSRELHHDTFNHKQLIILTSQEFYDWMKTKYFKSGEVLYCQELFDEYCAFYKYNPSQRITKQLFNEYLRFTCVHLTGKPPIEGRRTKGKFMIFNKDINV